MSWQSLVVAAAAVIFAVGGARAAESVTVTVYATVLPVCKFLTSAPVVNIADLGVGSSVGVGRPGPPMGSAEITYRCSNGTVPSFAIAAAAATTAACAACPEAPSIVATFSLTDNGPGRGMGSGRDLTLTVKGQIAPSPYQTAAAGANPETLTVTVSP
jgi:hypothetical protein